jgi:hypothetical protein
VPPADAVPDLSLPLSTPVLLADGSGAGIRELAASDRPGVEQLFVTASADDLYTRFFTVGSAMVKRHVEHLFCNGPGTTSYVVERDHQVLGIADVERLDQACAEIAFFVAGHAHGRGVTTFVADVLPANRSMLEVFRDAGFEYELVNERGDVLVKLSTRRTPAVDAATAARHAAALARRARTPRLGAMA